MDRVEDTGNISVGYNERSEKGDLEPLFVCPIVLIGEAHRRASQSGVKYHVCIDFSEANGNMHWPNRSEPDLW